MKFNPGRDCREEEEKGYFRLAISKISTSYIVFLLVSHLVIATVLVQIALGCPVA